MMKILSHCIVGTTFLHLRIHASFLPSPPSTLLSSHFFSSFSFSSPISPTSTAHSIYLSFTFSLYSPLFFFSISTTSLPFFLTPLTFISLSLHLNSPVFPFPYLVFPSSFSLPLLPLSYLLSPLSPFCQVFSYRHSLYHCWQAFGSGKLCNASGGNWTLLCHCSCWAGCSRVHSSSPHLLLTRTPKPTQDGSCCTAGFANCIWNLVKVCGWSGAGSHDS